MAGIPPCPSVMSTKSWQSDLFQSDTQDVSGFSSTLADPPSTRVPAPRRLNTHSIVSLVHICSYKLKKRKLACTLVSLFNSIQSVWPHAEGHIGAVSGSRAPAMGGYKNKRKRSKQMRREIGSEHLTRSKRPQRSDNYLPDSKEPKATKLSATTEHRVSQSMQHNTTKEWNSSRQTSGQMDGWR